MKKLVLNDIHSALGGKMVEFAGFSMPVQYEGVKAEHLNIRNNVGVFDVSHMGEFLVQGTGAVDLIQKITSNDPTKITDGQVQYSCLPNDKGGIVDDLLIYRISDVEYMLVVNASNIQKDWDWIQSKNNTGAQLTNVSDDYCLFAVQGPNAVAAIQSLTSVDLKGMKYYNFKIDTFAGFEDVIISATGYTGAGGFEIYVQNENAVAVWNAIMAAGKDLNIAPAGLACRDTLRLEMGYCLYGNDIDETTSPIEAGLGWITKLDTDFSSVEIFRKQKEQDVVRKLVAFELVERGIPRKDYVIKNEGNDKIGRVTSGTMSPSTNKAIGLGYVAKEHSKVGSDIYIEIRDKLIKAKVVRLPFLTATV